MAAAISCVKRSPATLAQHRRGRIWPKAPIISRRKNSLCQLPQHKNRPKSKKQLNTVSVVARFYWISIT
jgi:hypothetical protein